MTATQQFVTDCQGARGEFKTEVGKLRLKELCSLEQNLIRAIDNYPRLRRQRNLGDSMTEVAAVSYDLIAHTTLCLLSRFPKWIDYGLREHRPLIAALASMNSWNAKELPGVKPKDEFGPVMKADLAKRFFFGDVAALEALDTGYTRSS